MILLMYLMIHTLLTTADHSHKTEFWCFLGILLKNSNEHPCQFYIGVPPTPKDSPSQDTQHEVTRSIDTLPRWDTSSLHVLPLRIFP